MQLWFLGWEDPLEEEMATHSSILAWKIPWTQESKNKWLQLLYRHLRQKKKKKKKKVNKENGREKKMIIFDSKLIWDWNTTLIPKDFLICGLSWNELHLSMLVLSTCWIIINSLLWTLLPTSTGLQRKQGNSRKISTSASLSILKPLTVWITKNCGKFLKRWE